tara:strand:- start:27 stop:875 length:849 start_codon:yes stop_codon:yes gene_type:complete
MQIYYVNGSFKHKFNALISVEDRGFNFSDGVYEVIGFKNKKLLNFKKHMKRLKSSLLNLRIKSPYKNFKSLELIIFRLIEINKLDSGFIYLQITRGNAKRDHLFPPDVTPNVVIFAFPKKKLSNLSSGVKVGLSEDIRWTRCDVKSISLLPNLLEKQKAYENGCFEIWQMRNNFITEGSTSNAFIIDKSGNVLTHPKNNLILGGVTRDTLIELAKKNKVRVCEEPFSINDIKKCKEAFLTSTTVGVIPVTQVNDIKINSKKIGEITTFLTEKYENFLNLQIK